MKKILLTLNKSASEDLESYCVTTNPFRLLCTSVEMTAVGLVRVVLEPRSPPQEAAPQAARVAGKRTTLWIRGEWICWALEDPGDQHGIGFHPG